MCIGISWGSCARCRSDPEGLGWAWDTACLSEAVLPVLEFPLLAGGWTSSSKVLWLYCQNCHGHMILLSDSPLLSMLCTLFPVFSTTSKGGIISPILELSRSPNPSLLNLTPVQLINYPAMLLSTLHIDVVPEKSFSGLCLSLLTPCVYDNQTLFLVKLAISTRYVVAFVGCKF